MGGVDGANCQNYITRLKSIVTGALHVRAWGYELPVRIKERQRGYAMSLLATSVEESFASTTPMCGSLCHQFLMSVVSNGAFGAQEP